MDVVMPQLGETVKEGTVIAWRKKVGERVEKDEPLFEVNTDKVDMDVPSPAAGTLPMLRSQLHPDRGIGDLASTGPIRCVTSRAGRPPAVASVSRC